MSKLSGRRLIVVLTAILLAAGHVVALIIAPTHEEIARALSRDPAVSTQKLTELVSGIQAEIAVQNICDVLLVLLLGCVLFAAVLRLNRSLLAISLLYLASLIAFIVWAIGGFKYGVWPAIGSYVDHLVAAAASGRWRVTWLSAMRVTSAIAATFLVLIVYRLQSNAGKKS